MRLATAVRPVFYNLLVFRVPGTFAQQHHIGHFEGNVDYVAGTVNVLSQ